MYCIDTEALVYFMFNRHNLYSFTITLAKKLWKKVQDFHQDKMCDQHIRDDDNNYKELELDRYAVHP